MHLSLRLGLFWIDKPKMVNAPEGLNQFFLGRLEIYKYIREREREKERERKKEKERKRKRGVHFGNIQILAICS